MRICGIYFNYGVFYEDGAWKMSRNGSNGELIIFLLINDEPLKQN